MGIEEFYSRYFHANFNAVQQNFYKKENDMSVWIMPYKEGSESVRLLKEAMGVRSIKLENSKWKNSPNRVVINWGNTSPQIDDKENVKWINHPDVVASSVNKIETFKKLYQYVACVPHTTNPDKAVSWLREGREVVARKKINGMGGEGITLCNYESGIPLVPLYTLYIPKKSEFRVHYVKGLGVIKIQRKARKLDVPLDRVNWKIRNINNGFIYALADDVDMSIQIRLAEMAKTAITKLGLDFGCLDVIYNETSDCLYLLEVNSAPGLSETTAKDYARNLDHLSRILR